MKRGLMISIVICIVFMLTAAGVFGYARWIEPSMLKITRISIPAPVKIKIAFFTDTHFGKDNAQENLEKIVHKINAEQADLVIFGGDFFDHYDRDAAKLNLSYIAAQFSEINGLKFAAHGNHDCGGGAENIFDPLMEQGGFQVLSDAHCFLEAFNLNLIGLNDYLLGTTPPELYRVSNGHYNVFLSHEPFVAPKIQTDTQGIMLSGHSHGGQIHIPFLSNKILPVGVDRFIKGFYPTQETCSNISLFVSSGIGTTYLPLRFGNIPEIAILEIGK